MSRGSETIWIPGTFVDLPDGAGAFAGQGLKVVRVNVGEDGLEYANIVGATDVWLPAEFVRLDDYGAVGDGVTDDTTAIVNALATGKHVYATPGKVYRFTDTITFSTVGQMLTGWPWLGLYSGGSLGRPAFKFDENTGKAAFHIQARSVGIKHLALSHYALTPTSGVGILVEDTGATGAGGDYCFAAIEDCGINYFYTGVKTGAGTWGTRVLNTTFYECQYETILVNSLSPWGGHYFRDLWVTGSGTVAGTRGIHVTAGDNNDFRSLKFVNIETAVYLNGVSNSVAVQRFSGVHVDNVMAGGYGIRLEGANTESNVFGIVTINGNTGGKGILVGSGPNHNKFIGGQIQRCDGGHAFEVNGTKTVINGYTCRRTASGSYDGFVFGANSDGSVMNGCSAENNRYGLVVNSGAANLTIQGNNFMGNATGAASLAAGVLGSCKIENNQGINDYLTSIAAAPDFIGQRALVAGQWYMAKGTAGTGDWVLIG